MHEESSVVKPVVQEETTGCGIASVANILGKTYSDTKKIANGMGICASDKALWSDTQYVRRMLKALDVDTSDDEIPFSSWDALPDLALLSIKHHQENGKNFWHWVVFKRVDGQSFVFDSASYLSSNLRTDFDNMQPKWYIEVKCIANKNQWNQLTDIFGCKWEEDSIPECAADNICIAWPSIIECIEQKCDTLTNGNALDFGCGGGLFCQKLHQMGYCVTGYDESEELVEKAQINTPQGVTITNSSIVAAQKGPYALITSIMVFQFIRDIESTIKTIVSLAKPNALIVYAVFNPEFVENNLNGSTFTGLRDEKTRYMELKKGVVIPFYNRTSTEYGSLFAKFGYEEIYCDLPVFTDIFLSQYQMPFSTKYPEYLIQGFRKGNT
jgi:2-polyprenyl-3-methyl-5-hydroxy-6-metoxy-1,4-benzoquinol methylase